MTSTECERVENCGLSSHAYFIMAFASDSCDELEGENIFDDPSSAENSCLDDIEALGHMPDVVFFESNEEINESSGNSNKRQSEAGDILDVESLHSNRRGWTKSLKDFPAFSHEKLENKLVKNNRKCRIRSLQMLTAT